MRIIECIQRSEEWDKQRLGIPTASGFSKIITSKGARSKQREGYMYTLAAQRISGRTDDTFFGVAMAEGILREQESRLIYAMTKQVGEVIEVGFCLEDGGRYGCSPDGLVGDDGLVELKNPIGKTAIEYLLKGELPSTYYHQVQGQLLVTERAWCDFVSYYPGLPMLILRQERDEPFIDTLATELAIFSAELDVMCSRLKGESVGSTAGDPFETPLL